MARRTLADISNVLQKDKPLTQDQKSQSIPTTVKEYIEQLRTVMFINGFCHHPYLWATCLILDCGFLIQENMALAKMLAQRKYCLWIYLI